MMGAGVPVPWVPVHRGRRQWVGINFCYTEVVKLQQQCHMKNTIFYLPQTAGYIHFFWERESANILTATGELEGKM